MERSAALPWQADDLTATRTVPSQGPVIAPKSPPGWKRGPSAEIRRFSAGMRVVTACLCAVLLYSHSALGRASTALLLVYAVWAAAVLWSETRGRALPATLVHYWIDLTWIGLMVQSDGPTTDMLVLIALQPVLLASIGYGVRQGVLLAVCGALWALIQVEPGGTPLLRTCPTRTLEAMALLMLGTASAALAGPVGALRRRLALLNQLEARLDPRRGLGSVASTLVEELRQDIDADLAGIVLPASARGEALLCTKEDGSFPAKPEVHARLEMLLAAMPPCAVTYVVPGPLPWHGGVRLHAPQPLAAGPELRRVLGELCTLLDMRMLVVLPMLRYEKRHGHLLVGRCGPQTRDQDVRVLSAALPVLFRLLEQAALVDQLVRETSAHERMRIGRDLHDSAIQPYVGLRYALEAVLRSVAPDNPAHAGIASVVQLLDGEIGKLREIVSNLRNGEPWGDNALQPAVKRQLRHFSELFGIEAELTCSGPLRISRALAGEVFHLVNEALNNVRKHTAARHVHVDLRQQDGWLRLCVSDDGGSRRGSPAPEFHPRSLSERVQSLGGRLTLTRPDGLNTEIVITIPHDDHPSP